MMPFALVVNVSVRTLSAPLKNPESSTVTAVFTSGAPVRRSTIR